MKKVFFMYFCCLLHSCATNNKQDVDVDFTKLPQVQEENLVEKFHIEVDTANKYFPTAKIEEDEKTPEEKIIEENPKKKIVEKIAAPIIIPETKKVFSYPQDFPQELISYDQDSEKLWKKFKPVYFLGEKMQMEIRYFGITCGSILIESLPIENINGKPSFHYNGRMVSAKFYSYLYTLDDSIETYVSTEKFLPQKYSIIQRESNQSVDDLQLFDWENLKTNVWYKRIKNNQESKIEKSVFIPRYVQDSFSALFFVRGLPLQTNDKYEFPVATRGKLWIIKIRVGKPENIKINGKLIPSIKLYAQTHFPGVLEKKGDILFWYSIDPDRKLLKFSAKVKIGTIDGELVKYSK